MKKLFALIIFSLIISTSMLLAPATHANNNHNSYYDRYENFPSGNSQFHPRDPDYYDGNLRYTLKTRADIERASSSTLHYDEYSRDYYRCNWIYNKNLGSWVCEKDYGTTKSQPKAQAVTVCPVGYAFSQTYQTCLSESQPVEVQYVSTQPTETVVIEPTVTYYVYGDSETPVRLPQTGPIFVWMIAIASIAIFAAFFLFRKQNTNKQSVLRRRGQ